MAVKLCLATLLGIGIGAWRMQRLRGDAARLLENQAQPLRLLLRDTVLRALPAILLLAIVLAWSAASLSGALAGYWLGRTGLLLVNLRRRDRQEVGC